MKQQGSSEVKAMEAELGEILDRLSFPQLEKKSALQQVESIKSVKFS